MVPPSGVVVAMPSTTVKAYSCEASALQPARNYQFIDYTTQFYLGVVGLLILFFHSERVPFWQFLLGGHAAGMIAIHLLIRVRAAHPNNRALDFLRYFYPIILFGPLYCESVALNLMFVGNYLDGVFIELEQRLFGFQPSVRFMAALPYLFVSEFFHMSYFSYYVIIPGIGFALYFQEKGPFFHYVSVISFVFYFCLLAFIFLPVIGPFVFYTEIPGFPDQGNLPFYPLPYPPAVKAGPFFHIMKLFYGYFEGHGGAFPSSHVAVAICTLYFSWRYLPRFRHLHIVAVILICFSTVYCRYHYAVDVLAGLLTAALLLPLGEFLYRRLQ